MEIQGTIFLNVLEIVVGNKIKRQEGGHDLRIHKNKATYLLSSVLLKPVISPQAFGENPVVIGMQPPAEHFISRASSPTTPLSE